jgi:uncharacterized protein (TIGR03382 family)
MQTRTAAGIGISIAALGLGAIWLVRRRKRRMRMAEQQPQMLDPDDIAEVVIVETLIEEPVHDAGELYGVHVPAAEPMTHLDDDAAQSYGENWLEQLAADTVEAGPLPEQPVDIVDEDDVTSPRSDTRDRPVADRGSAGPRGM